ncbi:PRC-barrel domain-containing protein [Mycobacterium sp. URHB0021]
MQLSELLELPVRDAAGRQVGTVVDVRLAIEGDLDDRPDQPKLFGLIISPHTESSYLGYERADARRPKLLAALLRWRHRGTFLALWHDIANVSAESVGLRQRFERYSPVLRDDDQRSSGEHQNPN